MLRILFVIFFSMILLGLSGPYYACAETTYGIKEMTPAVSLALENRKERYSRLSALKGQGFIGENNRGYVEAFNDGTEVASIVSSENDDRKIIYQTIAEQNGLENAIATIEEVFAQVQRDKARSGEKIQDKDGAWITK